MHGNASRSSAQGSRGLTAAITCAEAGTPVVLYDAHGEPGGRARSLEAPYRANLGPHVLYSDGALWGWLKERDLLPPSTGIPYTRGCGSAGAARSIAPRRSR